MSERSRRQRPYIARRRAPRGQSLIVALGVLFVLLFIGGVFVAQIARNLTVAGRSREVQDANALAEAGVRYCDEQLTRSPEGADWRPTPTPPITSVADPLGLRDPDYYWLVELGGFTRIQQKGGRFLVRVTYDPTPDDPNSQLIRIESIGRPGEVSENDPTVFVNPQNGIAPRLRRELVAAKQIGLTDYLRFITNKNRSVREAQLGGNTGVPVSTVFGEAAQADTNGQLSNGDNFHNGGIRSNASLKFVGDVFVYASRRGNNLAGMTPEGVFATGEIRTEATRDVNGDGVIDGRDYQAFLNVQSNANQDPINPSNAIRPSTDPNFSTNGGLLRDGSSSPDALGYNRNIPFLEPPVIDGYSSGTGVLRYRELTRDSGVWIGGTGNRYNTGAYGWGRGVYVDNAEDLQKETVRPGITGGYSLRADWLNPNSQFAQGYWQGPFYRPPGVLIELLGDRIRMTRNDGKRFRLPDGSLSTLQGGNVVEIPLSHTERDNYTLPNGTAFALPRLSTDGDEPNTHSFRDPNSYGVNLVLFTEGNVRVKGALGVLTDPNGSGDKLSRVRLTIVSGGTAYIEGSVKKTDGSLVNGTPELERGSSCAILAKDYVCVNTTMFVAPKYQANFWSRSVDEDNPLGFYTEVGQSRQSVDFSFSHGYNTLNYRTQGQPSPLFLMVRHARLGKEPSFINLLVNPGLAGGGAYAFNQAPAILSPTTYVLGFKFPPNTSIPATDETSSAPNFERRAFRLGDSGIQIGFDNLLRFQLDQTGGGAGNIGGYNLGAGGSTDYLLGGVGVVPMDVEVDALMYAQEKSFFIIPGYPTNPDTRDTREAFAQTGTRPTFHPNDSPEERLLKSAYPFYNEPMDVRLTLRGAIAENYPASSSDQAAWTARWGWIPTIYGNTDIPIPDQHLKIRDEAGANVDGTLDLRTPQEVAANITRGIRYLYDRTLAMPYGGVRNIPNLDNELRNRSRQGRSQLALRSVLRQAVPSPNNPGQTLMRPIRQVLPALPRLPVCPGFVYFGEPDRRIDGAM